MVNPSYREIALRYCVDDLPGASLPGARLQKILECLQLGRSVTPLSLTFLQKQGLEALYRLATGASSYDSFREWALVEQSVRVKATTAAKLNREAENRAREAEARAREAAMQAKMKLALEQAEAARRVGYRLASASDSFRERALSEQSVRIETATAARLNREAEERAREAAMQARMKLA